MIAEGTCATESKELSDFARAMGCAAAQSPGRIALGSDDAKNGLAKLVLTLVELIRQLLERQAIRRMESGSLNHEQTEKLGVTFMQLSEQMQDLKKQFHLEDEELNLDLGPLGKLL